MGMGSSKLQEMVKVREAWRPALHGVTESWTRLKWLNDIKSQMLSQVALAGFQLPPQLSFLLFVPHRPHHFGAPMPLLGTQPHRFLPSTTGLPTADDTIKIRAQAKVLRELLHSTWPQTLPHTSRQKTTKNKAKKEEGNHKALSNKHPLK